MKVTTMNHALIVHKFFTTDEEWQSANNMNGTPRLRIYNNERGRFLVSQQHDYVIAARLVLNGNDCCIIDCSAGPTVSTAKHKSIVRRSVPKHIEPIRIYGHLGVDVYMLPDGRRERVLFDCISAGLDAQLEMYEMKLQRARSAHTKEFYVNRIKALDEEKLARVLRWKF